MGSCSGPVVHQTVRHAAILGRKAHRILRHLLLNRSRQTEFADFDSRELLLGKLLYNNSLQLMPKYLAAPLYMILLFGLPRLHLRDMLRLLASRCCNSYDDLQVTVSLTSKQVRPVKTSAFLAIA